MRHEHGGAQIVVLLQALPQAVRARGTLLSCEAEATTAEKAAARVKASTILLIITSTPYLKPCFDAFWMTWSSAPQVQHLVTGVLPTFDCRIRCGSLTGCLAFPCFGSYAGCASAMQIYHNKQAAVFSPGGMWQKHPNVTPVSFVRTGRIDNPFCIGLQSIARC